jgi:hypothetical protein
LFAVGTRGDELLVFEVSSAKSLVAVESPAYWGGPMLLSFLGKTGFILGAGQNMYIYDFPNRQWLKIDAFEQDRDLKSVGGVAVDGNSIFVCDYSGNLRRFDWSVAKRNGDAR